MIYVLRPACFFIFIVACGVGYLLVPSSKANIQKLPIAITQNIGHSSSVAAIRITPDGRHMVTAGGALKLWDVNTGVLLHTFGSKSGASAIAITPDGRRVVSSGAKTLKLWDLESGRLIRTYYGHSDGITSLALSPDGRHIVSGTAVGEILFWDLETGDLIRTMTKGPGYADNIWSLAITPDNKLIFSGGQRDLTAWSGRNGKYIGKIPKNENIFSLAFSRKFWTDKRLWLRGGEDKKIWVTSSGEDYLYSGHSYNTIMAIRIASDEKRVVSLAVGSNEVDYFGWGN